MIFSGGGGGDMKLEGWEVIVVLHCLTKGARG